ncbi:MAG: PqqD family protein [Pseudomonadota bacterium]
MKEEVIYSRVEECLLEDMDGELLLYNPNNATTLHLNDSSAVVWELCDGERTAGEIVSMLQSSFPDQAEQVATDVADVIDHLLEREVLQAAAE